MLPSLDDKCSPKGCWYCCNLCHYCLQPVAMKHYSDRKEKAHLSNTLLFCSELCYSLLLEPPSKFQSVFFFDLRNQQTEIGRFMPSPILHVLKAKPTLAYGNTVVSIILNTDDGSEGLPWESHMSCMVNVLSIELVFMSYLYQMTAYHRNAYHIYILV